MSNKQSCYEGPEGVAFGHTVIDDLGGSAISPTPANYEVWATYRSGAFPDLNREIEDRLGAGAELNGALFEELFERFFSTTQSFDQLLQTSESIAHELVGALEQLRQAGESAGSYAGELEGVVSVMATATEPRVIRLLVQRLMTETQAVALRNRDLEQRMEASSKQMEALQANVRQATLEAMSDGLTGLANRKHFDRVLARRVREASESGEPLCLILCDIDHFKQINDNWGHPVGDQVIRYVASSLRTGSPPTALAARYGGEEYALLLPQTTLAASQSIAETLCECVRARQLSRRSSGAILGHVTISAGVAQLGTGETSESLVKRADVCLYRAKRAGRNRVAVDDASTAVAA